MKKWKVNKPNTELVNQFKRQCDLSKIAIEVMVSRGYDNFDDIVDFFNCTELDDPFELADMQSAVDTIMEAVNNYELICIYGDYDCDGVTSTTILYNYLLNMGADVCFYIPQRSEGYGLNIPAIEKLSEQGVKLIITVDNGISAIEQSKKIYELGMKLVITDHHQPLDTFPMAEAVVNPHRKDCFSHFKYLAGVGVVFKLCAALDGGNYDMVMEQYSDICAIGTIADIVSLTGENRTIVQYGLRYLKNTENLGLNFLMEKAKVDLNRINSTSVASQIAPRINAAGRFGSAVTAVEAFMSEDEYEASENVEKLISLNNQRKEAENNILNEIDDFINNNPQILNDRVLIVAGTGWHHGVIGIVSSKILDRYGKPNVIISFDENGVGRGSARSIKGFNIFKCFDYASDFLEQYGGHECAGGLTVKRENLEDFRQKVLEFSNGFEQMPVAEIIADKQIMPEDFTINNIKSLEVLEPFGTGNSEPIFAMIGARVERIFSLSQSKHTKIDVTYGGVKTSVLIFFQNPDSMPFVVGDRVDLMVSIGVNVFAGKENLSIKALDYRIHGFNQSKYFAAKDCYEKYRRGENLPLAFLKKINPDRQELVKIYKTIGAFGEMAFDRLYMRLDSPEMNYCKLKLAVDAFEELGLVSFLSSTQNITVLPVKQRVDMESSQVLIKLREKIRGGN